MIRSIYLIEIMKLTREIAASFLSFLKLALLTRTRFNDTNFHHLKTNSVKSLSITTRKTPSKMKNQLAE